MMDSCDFRLGSFDFGALRGGVSAAGRFVPLFADSGGGSSCEHEPPIPDAGSLRDED